MKRNPKLRVQPTGFSANKRRAVDPTNKQQEEEVDDALRTLVREVRDVYKAERSDFEELISGGVEVHYNPPKRYNGVEAVYDSTGRCVQKAQPNIWLKLAKFFAANKIDPKLYIQAQFEVAQCKNRAPEPTQLMSDRCLAEWEEAKERKGDEIEMALNLQRNTANMEIAALQRILKRSLEDAYLTVILNTSIELSALFRFCLATSLTGEKFRAAAELFEAEACIQFERFRKHYVKHWGKLLPKGFKKRARLVYADLYEGIVDEDEI